MQALCMGPPRESDTQATLTDEFPARSRLVRLVAPERLREHFRASFVPLMRPNEFDELVADIASRGIVNPLEVLGDVVLDGRHRLKAAKQLALPQFRSSTRRSARAKPSWTIC